MISSAETSKSEKTSIINVEAASFTFLKPIKLKQVSFWDFVSNVSKINATKFKFKQVKLQDLIKQRKGFFIIDNEIEYKRCKVQLYAKGVILRDIVKGKEIKTKKQQVCKEDDFLVAEIDAKVGGYGIVPKELENAVVSSHYYLYEIDKIQLLPEFLGLYVKTEEFAKQVKASGSTNYASIRPNQVLEYFISLPPIKTQEKLVINYNTKILQAEAKQQEAEKLEKGIETYLFNELGIEIQEKYKTSWKGFTFLLSANLKDLSRWNVNYLLNKEFDENSFKTKFPTLNLSQITKSVGGGTPSKSKVEFWSGIIPWVSPKDMKTDFISETQDYISELAVKSSAVSLIDSGHLIFVMRSGILQHTVPVAVNERAVTINQDLRAFKVTTDAIRNDYLLRYFQYTQPILLKLVKTGTTVQSIDLKRLEDLKIPIPPLKIQEKIVKHINSEIAEIKQLKSEAEDLRNEAKAEFEAELFEKS